jgi:hypothetical protein
VHCKETMRLSRHFLALYLQCFDSEWEVKDCLEPFVANEGEAAAAAKLNIMHAISRTWARLSEGPRWISTEETKECDSD